MDDCHLSNITKLEKKKKKKQTNKQTKTTRSRLQVENSHMLFAFFSYIASQKITKHVIVATEVASSRHTDSPHLHHSKNPSKQRWPFPIPASFCYSLGAGLGTTHTFANGVFLSYLIFSSFQSLCPFGLFWLLMVLKRFCHPTDPQQGFWHMSRFDDSSCTKQKSLQNILNISFNMFANCI
jgi:hypothetical protein